MRAAYVFRVRFRLDPEGVRLDPDEFETVLRRPATRPEDGDDWLFFRDNLWRGEIGDERHVRELASELLGADVTSIEFAELETDRECFEALKSAIASEVRDTGGTNAFNADDVDEVLNKYLGSSIHVRES